MLINKMNNKNGLLVASFMFIESIWTVHNGFSNSLSANLPY